MNVRIALTPATTVIRGDRRLQDLPSTPIITDNRDPLAPGWRSMGGGGLLTQQVTRVLDELPGHRMAIVPGPREVHLHRGDMG